MRFSLSSLLRLAAVCALVCSLAHAADSTAADPALPKISEPIQREDNSVYRARREALMKEMGEGVAVVFGDGEEDGDGYRPNSDLFYLTGVTEPDAILVLAPKERTYREFLLLPVRDPEAERWTGERDPISKTLREKYGFEKILRSTRLNSLALELVRRSPAFWQLSTPNAGGEKRPADLELYGKISSKLTGVSTKGLPFSIARMRSRHSAGEIAIMQKAVRISEAGFRAAILEIKPGAFEGAVEAAAEKVWKTAGARRPAYASIVGSGPNSTILHYPQSERTMQDGELLLMDMACEYAHYAADITRTFPVNGKFTPEQRKIYNLVLKAQLAAFALLKPGAYAEALDAAARKVLEAAGIYAEPLQAGMVITLEPGIYLPHENFGVRIEDDVLITETGAKMLSDGLPREADEIEKLMSERGGKGK